MATQTYREPSRDIPIAGAYDVLVCGAGTSGFPAAVAAAKLGCKTALLERYGFVGGVPAFSIMPAWHRMQRVKRGALIEFGKRVAAQGPGPDPTENRHMEPESVKQVALEMVEEAGVELHLHSLIVGVIQQGGTVIGVITESKSGRRAYLAQRIIDATGDGDVCVMAGANYFQGRKQDGVTQGLTVRFRIGYINFERYFDWIADHRPYYHNISDERLARIRARALAGKDFYLNADLNDLYVQLDPEGKLPRGSYFNGSSIRPGELSLNATRVNYLDGTREEDLTRAEVTCRKQAHALFQFLRAHVPGFEDARLVETATQVGVRETRCIEGDYVITEADCRAGKSFDDAVLASEVTFDMHDPDGYVLDTVRTKVELPYRCLLPKGLDRVLVVGRCISSDHWANSGLRQMVNAYQLGIVGGTAAALSVQEGVPPRDLSYTILREALSQAGVTFRDDLDL